MSIHKILITHARPHFDDVLAMWFAPKVSSDFTKAEIAFTDENRQLFRRATAIGISRGQFDEHKGDEGSVPPHLFGSGLKFNQN